VNAFDQLGNAEFNPSRRRIKSALIAAVLQLIMRRVALAEVIWRLGNTIAFVQAGAEQSDFMQRESSFSEIKVCYYTWLEKRATPFKYQKPVSVCV
jgi:hypothetical protein